MEIFSLLLISFISFAGGVSSGGGESTVCTEQVSGQIIPEKRQPNGDVEYTRLFDFFEGEKIYDLSITRHNNLSFSEQLKPVVEKFVNGFRMPKGFNGFGFKASDGTFQRFYYIGGDSNQFLANVLGLVKMFPVKSGITVEPIHDRKGAIDSKYCPAQPVAQYIYEGKGIIRKDIFDVFTETDKAGFYLHESLYAGFRADEDQTDSRRARLMVSHAFANNFNFVNIYDGIDLAHPPKDSLACLGTREDGKDHTIFIAYPSEQNEIYNVNFVYMGGRQTFSKKTVGIPRKIFNFYLNQEPLPMGVGSRTISNIEGGENIGFRVHVTQNYRVETWVKGDFNWYPDLPGFEQKFFCTPLEESLLRE